MCKDLIIEVSGTFVEWCGVSEKRSPEVSRTFRCGERGLELFARNVPFYEGAVRFYFVLKRRYRRVAMNEETAPITIPTPICNVKNNQKRLSK